MKRIVVMACLFALSLFAQRDGRMQFDILKSGWSSSNNVHDATGRMGAWTGSTGITHVGGGQFYFPGTTSNRIQQAGTIRAVSTNDSFAIVLAFCATNQAGASDVFYSETHTADTVNELNIALSSSNLEFFYRARVSGANQTIDLIPMNRVVDGGWHHVALLYTGKTVRAWLDGVQVGQLGNASLSPAITAVTAQAVGVLPRTTAILPFHGMMERVQTFVPCPADAEIQFNYIQWRATRR